MADLLQVLETGTYAAFIAGAIFAVMELRTMSRDRKTQLIMNVWSTFNVSEFAEAHSRIDMTETKDWKDIEAKCHRADINKVMEFYEGLGLLVRKRLVDPELVLEMCYPRLMWAKLKPWIDEERHRVTPFVGEHFEYLAQLDTQYKMSRLPAQVANRSGSSSVTRR